MQDDGFTLIEILISTVVIGILAAIAGLAFIDVRQKANLAGLEADVRNMAMAVETYSSQASHQLSDVDGTDARSSELMSQGLHVSLDAVLKVGVTGTDYCISGTRSKVPSVQARFRRSTGRVELGPAGSMNC